MKTTNSLNKKLKNTTLNFYRNGKKWPRVKSLNIEKPSNNFTPKRNKCRNRKIKS